MSLGSTWRLSHVPPHVISEGGATRQRLLAGKQQRHPLLRCRGKRLLSTVASLELVCKGEGEMTFRINRETVGALPVTHHD